MNKRFRTPTADIAFTAVLILCAALCILALSYQADAEIRQQNEIYLSVARRDALYLQRDIGHLLQDLDAKLKALLDARPHGRQPQKDILRHVLDNAPYLRSISRIDSQGKIIASTEPGNIGYRLDSSDYLSHPQTSGDNTLPLDPAGHPHFLLIGPAHSGHDIADGIPLTDNGKPTPNPGFIPIIYHHLPTDNIREKLVATLNLEYLLNRIGSVIETQGTRVALLRADGLRLLDTAPADAGLLMIEREIGKHWRNGNIFGVQEQQAVDNRKWIIAHRLYPQLPIGVVWAADRDRLLEEINRNIRRNNLTVILLMVVGMVCTLFGYIFFRHASRHERERHLKTEQQRRLLENTLDACANAMIITNPDGLIVWANPAYTTLTGHTVTEATGRKPGDLEKSGMQDSAFYANMWQTIRDGRVWHGELINRRKDGSLYDALLTIAPSLDSKGVIQHFIATKTDITEHKAAREELEIAHSHLNAVVENFPGALVMEDTTGQIVLLNQYLFELMGLPGSNDYVLGKPVRPLMVFSSRAVESSEAFMARVEELRAALRPVYGEELHFKDGRWIERDFIPIRLHGKLIGFLYIYRDISQRKRHARELWQLAATAPLTGIPNRRAFFEDIEHERTRLARYPGEAAILMIDIDHFKQINDTYGHAAGDAMLSHVVRQIRKLLRESDILARLGGEEFAILLPQTNLEGARGLEGACRLAERIRKVLEDNPLNYNDIPIHVTASVGVTIMTAGDLNTDQTMSRADHALYEAKRNGRNRVEVS